MGEICIQSSEVPDVFTGCDGKRDQRRLYYRSKDHGSGGKADLYECKTDRIGYGIIPYLKGSEGLSAEKPTNEAYFFIKLKNREYV